MLKAVSTVLPLQPCMALAGLVGLMVLSLTGALMVAAVVAVRGQSGLELQMQMAVRVVLALFVLFGVSAALVELHPSLQQMWVHK